MVGASLLAVSVSVSAAAARAQPDPGVAVALDQRLVRAKELNRQGIVLLDAGDLERALSHFEESRASYPSAQNAANIAICLDRLGRHDEALEAYELLLLRYSDSLDEDDRASIAPAMETLRTKVARLRVGSNVGGRLSIDTRERGDLPLRDPLRITAGRHRLRVAKAGFSPFETSIEVAAGELRDIDAKLTPLAGLGGLRVEHAGPEAADVVVDGSVVGTSPWEGTLAKGAHLVWVARGELGSAPASVSVLEGQTALLRLVARPLGSGVRLRARPVTASLELDGVRLGGGFDGRLPPGNYRLTASEAGYRSATRDFVVPPGGPPVDVEVSLAVSPEHPRWPQSTRGRAWALPVVGYAGGPSLGSGAENACPERCSADPWAHGVIAGVRAGYRFPSGLSLESVLAGLWVGMSIERTVAEDFVASADGLRFDLRDQLRVRGPLLGFGASYLRPLTKRVTLGVRLATGVLVAFSNDTIVGTASATGPAEPIVLEDRDPTLVGAAAFVWPSVEGRAALGPVQLSVGLGAMIVPTEGPGFAHQGFGAQPRPDSDRPAAPGNAPLSDAIADERAHGPFLLLVPEIGIEVPL